MFEIKNPTNIERFKEPVSIQLKDLPVEYQSGNISVYKGKDMIPFQIDDLDQNGKPDELFMLLDIKPNESIKLEIRKSNGSKRSFKQLANVRFGEVNPPYKEIDSFKRVTIKDSFTSTQLFLMEGIGFENDKVAFRNYYDQRNGMDIFGKRIPDMVLDSVGIRGTDYHKLADWGMDILHVGNSLGAGAIALEINDTVYPVRNLDESYYHLISDGPLRAIFKLEHKNVKINNRVYQIDQYISIYGGSFFYIDEVVVNGLNGDEKLVTGIVNLYSDSLYIDHPNDKYTDFYTHSIQAMDTTYLGMGIIVSNDLKPEKLSYNISTKGIESTYMIAIDFNKNNKAKYWFYEGWERTDSGFKNREYFRDLLINDANKFANPLEVNLLK